MEGDTQVCTNALVVWLTSGTAAIWLERFYWAGGAIIGFVAMAAIRRRALQARAAFLLQLSHRWADLKDARKTVQSLAQRVTENVTAEYSGLDDDARESKLREKFKSELGKLQKTREENEDYDNIAELCGFFEIVGLMVERKYIPLKDVAGLLKGPVLNFERIFGAHIEQRQGEQLNPPGLYENALELSRKMKEKYGESYAQGS